MSFSSRVIAEPSPPVSAQVKHLGLMMWALPILLSLFCFLISPRSNDLPGTDMVNGWTRLNSAEVVAELPDLQEPQSFARVGSIPESSATPVIVQRDDVRFPLAADPWARSPFSVGKIAMKADAEIVELSRRQQAPPAVAGTQISTIKQSRIANVEFGESRSFRRVKVMGATAILADNMKIVLAGVEPLPQEATCRRIDGVMQSCAERAEHRLAILLQARSVTCELSETLENGLYLGRCLADKIDIANDLLRQKLAQRPSSTMAANNL